MKKIFILGCILVSIVGKYSAVNYTWTLTTAGNASNAASWSPNGIPGANDNVIFDGTSTTNCTWDIITVTSMSLMSGYTGVIDMGSSTRNIKQNLVINSGTLIATSGTLNRTIQGVTSSFILGGTGVFTHNSGTFALPLDGGDSYTFSGNIVLNILLLRDASTSSERSINFGSNLTVNTLSYSGSAPDPISFQGTIHIKTSLNFSSANYTSVLAGSNTGTLIFDGTGADIIGLASAGMGWLPNVQISTTGTYSMTNHLNVTGSWTGTSGQHVLGTSTTNFYGTGVTISGSSAAFDNVAIQTGASVTMPASAEVLIGGNLTKTGTLNFPASSLLGLNGVSGTQLVNLSGVSLAAVTCYSAASGRNVTLSGSVNILDSLRAGDNVTLNTGGGLTLKAGSGAKARLGFVGPGASVTGNVTVETFIPGGTTGWSMLGVSGVSGEIIANWDTYVSSGGTNGIPMTCQNCAFGVNSLGNYFESIQGWEEPAEGYDTSFTASSPLDPGKGFWVYIGNGAQTSTPMTLVNNGPLVTGPQGITVTKNSSNTNGFAGYNLVANPYASPISWDRNYFLVGSNAGNLLPTIYTYDPDNGDSQLIADGVGGSGTNGLLTGILAAGQAFYVEVAATGVTTVDFDEIAKVTDNSGSVLKPASTQVQSFRLKITGALDHDDELFRFLPNATPFFDNMYDAHKLFSSPGYLGYPGSYDRYTSISTKDAFDMDYAIHSMPPLTQSLSIPLLAKVSTAGSYTISSYDFKDFNSCVTLFDKLTNTHHDLRQGDYVFTISDTTSAPRFDLILCRDESIPTGISELNNAHSILITQDQQGAFVKTAFAQSTRATISVYNLIGQKLMDDIKVEGTATTTRLDMDLHNQVVLIRVVSDQEISTKKILIH